LRAAGVNGLLDRPVVAFDIETIPDPDAGRRVGIDGSDVAVVHEMVRRASAIRRPLTLRATMRPR